MVSRDGPSGWADADAEPAKGGDLGESGVSPARSITKCTNSNVTIVTVVACSMYIIHSQRCSPFGGRTK